MILDKSRDFEDGMTAYRVVQKYLTRYRMGAVMLLTDECPRPIVASELKRLRRQVRVNIARTERRRLKAERRAVGIHNRGVE